jgi:predicted dehydrogenase
MNRRYGVGLVGVQPGRSWAAMAHIPALRAQPDHYTIVGLANTSPESAKRAAEATGIGRAFDSVDGMVAAPDVEIVVVTVKVPHHDEIVRKALNAGKHVYCEWPVGNGLAEARGLTALAREKGLYAIAGTQARVSPAMRYVRDLVADGFVGEVLSTTIVGSGMSWGGVIQMPNAYTLDVTNGASMLTIPFGHTISTVVDVLGEVESVSAVLATARKQVTVVETGETLPMTAHDQLLVAGVLASGAPISVHYRGGMPRGTGLLWEINGTDGDLQVTAIGGQAQLLDLSVAGATGDDQAPQPLPLPDQYKRKLGLDRRAENVGELYAAFAQDLATGSQTAPSFADAEKTHQLIAAIEESNRSGTRVVVASL